VAHRNLASYARWAAPAICVVAAVWMVSLYRASAVSVAAARTDRTLVASVRAEPRSFNRYTNRDLTTDVISFLTQSSLVRVDHVSGRLEPELAESWDRLPDDVTYRVKLREGLRFSDGEPFSSADVVFSFRAIYDKKVDSPLADSLLVHGRPLMVAPEDARTVTVRFPAPFGPGLRLLAGVPILPRHKLERSLTDGTFMSAWGPATAPSEIAGMGPFAFRQYRAGERLLFDRNPYYWQWRDGRQLPAVDHLALEIVRDQDAEELRLESGEIDFTQSELRPSDYGALKRATTDTRVALTDLGVGLDGDLLWFNLSAAKAKGERRRWLQRAEFRRAVAHAIDRDAFVSIVYLGQAVPGYGVVSPGNTQWHTDPPASGYDVAAAEKLLASLALTHHGPVRTLIDDQGVAASFTLLTQKGNTSLERGASVIRDSLAQLGIRVDVVGLEVGALIHQVMGGDYDAAYFRLLTTDTDPALNADFWLSSGSAHVWNPLQPAPSTAWEAEIDRLLEQISSTTEMPRRQALFGEVQRIMARENPALCFAFPRMWLGMNRRVAGATPAAFRPPVLWNPAVITIDPRAR
jgi:peptide/nickel transport system substrate-binding protein